MYHLSFTFSTLWLTYNTYFMLSDRSAGYQILHMIFVYYLFLIIIFLLETIYGQGLIPHISHFLSFSDAVSDILWIFADFSPPYIQIIPLSVTHLRKLCTLLVRILYCCGFGENYDFIKIIRNNVYIAWSVLLVLWWVFLFTHFGYTTNYVFY